MTSDSNEPGLLTRMRIIASMKQGDTLPPTGWPANDPDWANNAWATGLSKLLWEAITEIVVQRNAVTDLTYTGRWLLGIAAVSILLNAALLGWMARAWL